MFEHFEELLRRKNQRFICIDTGWPQPGPVRHTALIEHDVGPPVDSATLESVAEQTGGLPEIIEFYRRHGYARLYRDTIPTVYKGDPIHASAYYIAPPAAWSELREYFECWLDDLSEEEAAEALPSWLESYVVIGEVPNSGNYFLVPLVGPDRGKVFEFEHDGFEFIERGTTLASFLDSVSTVTDDLLEEIRCHTRYCDGHSDTQWLCQNYLYDADP